MRLEGKLCIFPGIPTLFQKMLDNLTPYLPLPPPSDRPLRLQIFTESGYLPFFPASALTDGLDRLPESSIAPYLTTLQKRVQPEGIRIGSYPVIQKVPSPLHSAINANLLICAGRIRIPDRLRRCSRSSHSH